MIEEDLNVVLLQETQVPADFEWRGGWLPQLGKPAVAECRGQLAHGIQCIPEPEAHLEGRGAAGNGQNFSLQYVPPTNVMGCHLTILLEVRNVRLLNTGKPTPHPWRKAGPHLRIRGADILCYSAGALHPHHPDNSSACSTETSALVREHNNNHVSVHRKLYKRHPHLTSLRLVQDVVSQAQEVSQQAKEAKWLQWCTTFSQHTTTGAAPAHLLQAHPHPNSAASL
ncbi:hypothetical protein E2C01_015454 [Portunus trituberculatus]|uniref:Uncharacterized protein n=1 Tax=Portunus trituberculatus TaxID=210409 RepID=A0A5B7DMY4_PORTR|nr:hypothetical protein [Portunus trituberculatus]